MELIFLATVTMYSCVGLPNQEAIRMNCPNGITAIGTKPIPYYTIACHRSRLGQTIRIQNTILHCEDVHGSKNKNLIDVYVGSYDEALKFGRQQHTAKLLTN